MSGGPANVPKRIALGCLLQTIIMILGIILAINMKDVSKVSSQNTNTITQVVDDWEELPFVSLTTTDDRCPAGTQSVFQKPWEGTEQGCLWNKPGLMTFSLSGTQTVGTVDEYDTWVR